MVADISAIRNVINQMDSQLRATLLIKDGHIQTKKLWENTYIKNKSTDEKQVILVYLSKNISVQWCILC